MKLIKITTLLVITLVGLLASCKDEEKPMPTPIEFLCANNSKTWQIEKLYVNDTLYPLSSDQLNYKRTYKSDSSYYDSDGISGKYNLYENGSLLAEDIKVGGLGKLKYKVETLSKSQLIIRLIDDGSSNPNTLFHFYAL